MQYPISEIEGISPDDVKQLSAAGIVTTADLLQKCATPQGRTDIGARTGLAEGQLLAWATRADLMRLPDVGPEYAALLTAAGLRTVQELRKCDPARLAQQLQRAAKAKPSAPALPAADTVAEWVRQAGTVPQAISF